MNAMAEPHRHDHERKDIDVFSLIAIVVILFIACACVFLIVTAMLHYFRVHEPSKTAGQANIPITRTEEFPPPRLEVSPAASLAEFRAAEEADLNSYAWIDRNTGTVRIPIERAMQLILERGLPDVGAGQTPLSLMRARPGETASPPRLLKQP
jgi:hypothetical protein